MISRVPRVNNVELLDNMKKWLKGSKVRPAPLPPFISNAIFNIATGCSRRPNFANYSFVEEMVAEAVYTCHRYANRFDPKKYNSPFAYFSKIIWQSFVKTIHKYEKIEKIERKLRGACVMVPNRKVNNDAIPRFASDNKPAPFYPITVTLNGKTKIIKTQKGWDTYCKKHNKRSK